MARRSYKTELGCIACQELTELGAGKEGWRVDHPNLLCAIDTHSLAVANRSTILVLDWSDSDGSHLKIRPELSPIKSECISAIEWLAFDEIRVIVAGTSCGYLRIYSLQGDLIHEQIVYHGRIIKLRVRGSKKGFNQDTSSEEFCVVMPGVIARFDVSGIQNMLQKWFEETQAQYWGQRPKVQDIEDFVSSPEKLNYQLWTVGSTVIVLMQQSLGQCHHH